MQKKLISVALTSILLFFAVILTGIVGVAEAQSRLPACPQDHSLRYRNCYGTFTNFNGKKYVGEFNDHNFNGQGTLTLPDGAEYVGEFKDDKRNGQGTHTSPSGDKYVGEWKDDKRTGQGTGTFPNGEKYVGEFKDGNRTGQGTYTYPSGNEYVGGKYVGEWKDGKLNGQGIFTSSSARGLTRAQKQEALQNQQTEKIIQEVVLFAIGVGLSVAIEAASTPRARAFNQPYQHQPTVPVRNCVGWPYCW